MASVLDSAHGGRGHYRSSTNRLRGWLVGRKPDLQSEPGCCGQRSRHWLRGDLVGTGLCSVSGRGGGCVSAGCLGTSSPGRGLGTRLPFREKISVIWWPSRAPSFTGSFVRSSLFCSSLPRTFPHQAAALPGSRESCILVHPESSVFGTYTVPGFDSPSSQLGMSFLCLPVVRVANGMDYKLHNLGQQVRHRPCT